jgi:hypothetical protein
VNDEMLRKGSSINSALHAGTSLDIFLAKHFKKVLVLIKSSILYLPNNIYYYNIMIAGIPFVLTGQLKTNTPHYIHFF